MLGYVCKYTPMELFEAMDTEITRLEPSVTDFNHADTLMHANICSYTKAVLEDVMEHDYEGVILTTCCDSIRRLYDTLKSQFPDKFFFLLDIPRKFNDFAVALYERQLKQMLTEYEAFSGKTLDLKRFVSMMQNKAALKKQENIVSPMVLFVSSVTARRTERWTSRARWSTVIVLSLVHPSTPPASTTRRRSSVSFSSDGRRKRPVSTDRRAASPHPHQLDTPLANAISADSQAQISAPHGTFAVICL